MGGRPESSSTQRKSFVQQMITLVEQMPHQLLVRSLPKSLSQGGTKRPKGTGRMCVSVCLLACVCLCAS